jgi:hypothetical protein
VHRALHHQIAASVITQPDNQRGGLPGPRTGVLAETCHKTHGKYCG